MTLFLCGFMGCGKTALGKALAKRLELPLVDMDDLIVEREGMTIPVSDCTKRKMPTSVLPARKRIAICVDAVTLIGDVQHV